MARRRGTRISREEKVIRYYRGMRVQLEKEPDYKSEEHALAQKAFCTLTGLGEEDFSTYWNLFLEFEQSAITMTNYTGAVSSRVITGSQENLGSLAKRTLRQIEATTSAVKDLHSRYSADSILEREFTEEQILRSLAEHGLLIYSPVLFLTEHAFLGNI